MTKKYRNADSAHDSISRLFLIAFVCSCILFWWGPSFVYQFILGIDDPVTMDTIKISFLALICFITGFLITRKNDVVLFRMYSNEMRDIGYMAGKFTRIFGIFSFAVAFYFFYYRSNVQYGEGEGLLSWQQAILYFHLFCFTLYLSTTDDLVGNRKRFVITVLMGVLPRLIVSLVWGRFFLAQAIVPLLLIFVARGWIKMNMKTYIYFFMCAIAIFLVPPIMRGDAVFGNEQIVAFLANGSTLLLFQNNMHIEFNTSCPPLLVSLTAKLIPYEMLGICTIDIWGQTGLPATLDRLLAYQEIGNANLLTGPGSNFLLELYVTGGIAAILAGSFLFGCCCKFLCQFLVIPGVFGAIWLECLTRALFAPRSNLGYVFERIPSLFLATLVLVAIALQFSRTRYKRKARRRFEANIV
jgi:hypothetical protein